MKKIVFLLIAVSIILTFCSCMKTEDAIDIESTSSESTTSSIENLEGEEF